MLRTATLMGGVPGLANLMEQYTRLSRTHRLATVMVFAPAALAIGIWLAAVTLPVAQLTGGVMIGGQFQSPHLLITATYGASGARIIPTTLCAAELSEDDTQWSGLISS